MNPRILVPTGISVLRIALAPLVFYTFLSNLQLWAVFLFGFGVFTDILDGYLARKLNASSNWGAYLDTLADFILILTAFSAFAIKGLYPYWFIILIIFMYVQFVLTSGLKKPVYDPIGKYYAGFLFISVGITLLFPLNSICTILLVVIVAFSLILFINRSYIIIAGRNLI